MDVGVVGWREAGEGVVQERDEDHEERAVHGRLVVVIAEHGRPGDTAMVLELRDLKACHGKI